MIPKKSKVKKNNLSEGEKPNLEDVIQIQQNPFFQTCQSREVWSQYQPLPVFDIQQLVSKKYSMTNLFEDDLKMDIQDELIDRSIGNKYHLDQTLQKNQDKIQLKDNMSASEKYQIGCKCKKIGCLKLYCECFANGKLCGKNCICENCANLSDNKEIIEKAKLQAKLRVPGCFKQLDYKVPKNVCNCQKSQCKKKYCECFSAGSTCNQFCKCKNCKNLDQKPFQNGLNKLKNSNLS